MLKAFVLIIALGPTFALPAQAQSDQAMNSEDNYLKIYVKMHDAENLEKAGNLKAAYEEYSACQKGLINLRKTDPQGSADLFMLKPSLYDKINDKLTEVKEKLDKSTPSSTASPSNK